jgi:hypothetical protein
VRCAGIGQHLQQRAMAFQQCEVTPHEQVQRPGPGGLLRAESRSNRKA